MEINLEEAVIGSVNGPRNSLEGRTLSQRKKLYKHKKTNSEVESLMTKI